MKTIMILAASLLFAVSAAVAQSQYPNDRHRGYKLRLPPQPVTDTLRIPLARYLPGETHYVVIARIKLPNDSLLYTLPGLLPTGDSFGVKLLNGHRSRSDTLVIYRRDGTASDCFDEINILAFSSPFQRENWRYDRSFATYLVEKLAKSGPRLKMYH